MSMSAGLAAPGAGVLQRVESGFGYFQSWWNRPKFPAPRRPGAPFTAHRRVQAIFSSLLA
jgi:hypothetical protein